MSRLPIIVGPSIISILFEFNHERRAIADLKVFERNGCLDLIVLGLVVDSEDALLLNRLDFEGIGWHRGHVRQLLKEQEQGQCVVHDKFGFVVEESNL